jgi:hypothetical protein
VKASECELTSIFTKEAAFTSPSTAAVQDFLTSQTPYAGQIPKDREPTREELTLALTRKGMPVWNEQEFEQLLSQLGCAGYGYIRSQGVRDELERMLERTAAEIKQSDMNAAKVQSNLYPIRTFTAYKNQEEISVLYRFTEAEDRHKMSLSFHLRPHRDFEDGKQIADILNNCVTAINLTNSPPVRFTLKSSLLGPIDPSTRQKLIFDLDNDPFNEESAKKYLELQYIICLLIDKQRTLWKAWN